jgi:hypothetical protein
MVRNSLSSGFISVSQGSLTALALAQRVGG